MRRIIKLKIFYLMENKCEKKEILERLDCYIGLSEKGMELHEYDRKNAFKLAQQIRSYLKSEYKNNDLLQTYKQYKRNDYFLTYKKAIYEAFVSVTGPLSYEKLFSFLYDVERYLSICKYSIKDMT